MTQIDLTALPPRDRYKLLTAVVLPRPVAWVTTVGAAGQINAAPFSFFNVFGQDPALVILGLEHRADGSAKDTTQNIRRTGEFVINIVTPDLCADMVATAADYVETLSEVEVLGLALTASAQVRPPKIADAPVAMECKRLDTLIYSDEREIVVGEVVALAAHDGLIDDTTLHVDWQGHYPVARLFADKYARLDEIAPRAIPPLEETRTT